MGENSYEDRIRPMTLEESLDYRKKMLEMELGEIRKVLVLLKSNPDFISLYEIAKKLGI